jgi:hypothetical protein
MKRFLFSLSLISASFAFGFDRLERRIEKLVQPYQAAMDFVVGLDPARVVNDHDVFMFFNKNGLYKKQDVRKFERTVRIVKNLMRSKKLLPEVHTKIAGILYELETVGNFVTAYASTYAALITYYEIAAYYYYVDEQHPQVVDFLMEQSEKIGLPKMHKRNLYKLVKKINLDLRRLTALFTKPTTSDDLVVKMNQTKVKLLTLKSKIIVSAQYKEQLSKTRWLKAFGVIVAPAILLGMVYGSYMLWICLSGTGCLGADEAAIIAGTTLLTLLFAVTLGITMHELQESSKYDIPVHSTSTFSWF